MNKVILIGRLGGDPELRYTSSGTPVANFSVATGRKYLAKSGEEKDDTQWHKIVVWEKQAELCKEYLAKGRQVAIEGKLQTRSYEDRDGNKRSTTEVVAYQVEFLGSKGDNAGGSSGPRDEAPPADYPDEIPF